MQSLCRLLGAATVAVMVTVGLFWAMTRLVDPRVRVDESAELAGIHFVEELRIEPVELRQRRRPPRTRPTALKEPPVPVRPAQPFRRPSFDLALTGVHHVLANYVPSTRAGWGADLGHGLVARAMLPPMYPHRALLKGLEGEVVVGFEVAEDGKVTRAWVIRAQPREVFDAAALQAVGRWSFKPPVDERGRSTPVVAQQTITFRLVDTVAAN